MSTESPVLDIRELAVSYATAAGEVQAVRGFTLGVAAGECVGIVGESGAGKSQALLAVMGLLPPDARVQGSARFEGRELIGAHPRELDRVRGAGLSMIFQDPLLSLTPHLKIGDQIAESLVRHTGLGWKAARKRALQLLERVQIADPQRRMKQYPHELSGGMRQRVMIAIALACGPKLVIADEPTTALDVTVQAQILELLAELKREQGMSLVLITHDISVVAGLADRIAVMRAGEIVELGVTSKVLKHPEQAYTRDLLAAVPRIDRAMALKTTSVSEPAEAPASASASETSHRALLSVEHLRVQFKVRGGWLRGAPVVRAVDDVTLHLQPGEVVGIVGESGSGKSTLARAALRLLPGVDGTIVWLGRSLEHLSARAMRPFRRDMQLVFQDPLASLDPRMTVAEIVAEPLRVHRRDLDSAAVRQLVAEILLRVGLGRNFLTRYPHELSGGQAQRVAIARAMVLRPKLLVCDEAVSALDVSVQAQVISLIADLKRECDTAVLFISHNLAVVRQLCDRVLVLYLGRTMEQGPVSRLYASPAHPYTRALIAAIPVPEAESIDPRARYPKAAVLRGELPSPIAPPPGCVFHTRCPHAVEICATSRPALQAVEADHEVACHRWRELDGGG